MRERSTRWKGGGIAHLAFEIGIFFKGLDGVVELVGGVLLLLVPGRWITRTVTSLTRHEISEEPYGFFANQLRHLVEHLSTSEQLFAALYLLVHGAVKVFLVWALFRAKLWAYPTAMLIFGAFIVYQMYRYFLTHSIWMLALSVVDVIVIWLTWSEYRRLQRATA